MSGQGRHATSAAHEARPGLGGTHFTFRATKPDRRPGELFLASSNDLVHQFDHAGDPDDVVVDLSEAHIWDASSVAALDAVETKYASRGKKVTITGLDDPSARMHDRLAGELVSGH